jgi:hypothetical protein
MRVNFGVFGCNFLLLARNINALGLEKFDGEQVLAYLIGRGAK